jgi:cytochrome c556
MMLQMRSAVVAVLVGAAWICAWPLPAAAHDHATGVVKERMDSMEKMAKTLKAITQRVRAGKGLDKIPAAAQTIYTEALRITTQFPKGSNKHPSEAKASIWTNASDFDAKAAALIAASEQLATADTGNLAEVTKRHQTLARTCGACHELYREKR